MKKSILFLAVIVLFAAKTSFARGEIKSPPPPPPPPTEVTDSVN